MQTLGDALYTWESCVLPVMAMVNGNNLPPPPLSPATQERLAMSIGSDALCYVCVLLANLCLDGASGKYCPLQA